MEKEPKKKWTAEQLARHEDLLQPPTSKQQAKIDEVRRELIKKEGGPTPTYPYGETAAQRYMREKKDAGRGGRGE